MATALLIVWRKRKAMVPGGSTTRTSNIASFWRNTIAWLTPAELIWQKRLEKEIQAQIDKAIEEAQAIIFLVDLQSGIMPQEKLWAQELRKTKIPIIFVGNKADNPKIRLQVHEQDWHKLGFGEPLPISAVNGSGVGDMLDVVIEKLSPFIKTLKTAKTMEKIPTRVSIIGRPNVGKSSLFNALIGEERDRGPCPSRPRNDTLMLLMSVFFWIRPDCGVKAESNQTVWKNERAPNRKRFSAHWFDCSRANRLPPRQTTTGLTKAKSLIIVINKFDLFQDQDEEAEEKIRRDFAQTFPFLAYAPIVFVSAKTHWRVHKVFEMIRKVMLGRGKTIEEPILADLMKRLIHHRLPTKGKGVRHPHIYSLKQVAVDPPTFQVTIKQKTSLHESYLRFIENQLRMEFNLIGTPVVVYANKIKT